MTARNDYKLTFREELHIRLAVAGGCAVIAVATWYGIGLLFYVATSPAMGWICIATTVAVGAYLVAPVLFPTKPPPGRRTTTYADPTLGPA